MLINNKKLTIVLLLSVLAVFPACMSLADQEIPHDRMDSVMDSVMERIRESDLKAAVALLDDIIEQYPKYTDALKLRAGLLWGQGQGEAALLDMETILASQPDDLGTLFDRCRLQEAMGRDREVFIPCYVNVVEKIKQRLSGMPLEQDDLYVYAVILADLPEVELVKQRYLVGLESRQLWQDLDEDFRKDIIAGEKKRLREFDRNTLKESYGALGGKNGTASKP